VIAEDSWINVEVGEDGRYAVDRLLEMSETERGIIRQQRFRVAGTAEFNGMNRDIRDDRVKPLVDWTRMLFPDVDTNQVVPWAGLRPMMPNMMPRVGKGRQPGVFYNTGHGHLGWSLSAATAQMVAETIAGAFGTDVAIAA
jgi:D-amino-acid dehydrogenase